VKKTVQYFSEAYLKECQKFTIEQRIEFVENFREICWESEKSRKNKTKLVSIKIPENLLNSFRFLSEANGVPYQTQIKILMKDWVKSQGGS
jgi:predicted DNA binding CopG/RHH family protein